MDSVITLVKKEEPGGGGVEPEASPQIDSSVTVSPPPPASSENGDSITSSKKEKGTTKKRHKLFHSLLCCFGVRRRAKGPSSSATDLPLPETGAAGGPQELKPLLPELQAQDSQCYGHLPDRAGYLLLPAENQFQPRHLVC